MRLLVSEISWIFYIWVILHTWISYIKIDNISKTKSRTKKTQTAITEKLKLRRNINLFSTLGIFHENWTTSEGGREGVFRSLLGTGPNSVHQDKDGTRNNYKTLQNMPCYRCTTLYKIDPFINFFFCFLGFLVTKIFSAFFNFWDSRFCIQQS